MQTLRLPVLFSNDACRNLATLTPKGLKQSETNHYLLIETHGAITQCHSVAKVGWHVLRLAAIINSGAQQGRAQLPLSSSSGPSSPKDSPAIICCSQRGTSQSKLTSSIHNTNWEQQRKEEDTVVYISQRWRSNTRTPLTYRLNIPRPSQFEFSKVNHQSG